MFKKGLLLIHWNFLILSIIFVAGCSGFKEASREQFSGRFGDAPLNVHLTCQDIQTEKGDIGAEGQSEEIIEGSIGIGKVRDSRKRSDNVGYMWSYPPIWAPWLSTKLDLTIEKDAEIGDILLVDIKGILNKGHFSTEDIPNPKGNPTVILELEILETAVRSFPAKWTELRGTISGIFIFKASLLDAETGEHLWEGSITGKEELKVLYLLKRYHEETLNKAYCKAIDSFAKDTNTNNFKLATLGNLR